MATILSVLRQIERTEHMFRDPAAPVLRHLAMLDRLAAPTFALPNLWLRPNLEDHPALLYAPGGLRGDLVLARLGDEAALDRLARRIPWRLHGTGEELRTMNAELQSRAESTGRGREEVKHAALMTGLVLALGEREREQTHRFGQQWVVESAENPRLLLFIPRDARPQWYWRWLCDEAVKAARADLLGRSYPQPEMLREAYALAPTVDDANFLDTSDDPLTALLMNEREQEAARDLHALLAQVPPGPAMQELLPLLMEQLQNRPEPDFAEADRTLGLNSGTARQRFFQHRKRIRTAI